MCERDLGYEDITFLVHGQEIQAHRCVLCARSQYFNELLESKWKGRDTVTLNHTLVCPTVTLSPSITHWYVPQ